MKKVLFIINPISGTGKHKTTEKALLASGFSSDNYDIAYTKYAGHATEIAKKERNNYEILVAVGGDGSVNEVSAALIGTETALAIIPTGSGNGFARFLNIPLNMNKAIQVVFKGKTTKTDAVKINERSFVNLAGVGFDAHISHKFAKFGKRGLKSYVKLVVAEFLNYKTTEYEVIIDDIAYKKEFFLVSFANSSQFGNNAYIAPLASITDGLIDVVFMKRFPKSLAPVIATRLFSKNIHRSAYTESYTGKYIELRTQKATLEAHIDGEPVVFKSPLKISIVEKSLNVIIP